MGHQIGHLPPSAILKGNCNDNMHDNKVNKEGQLCYTKLCHLRNSNACLFPIGMRVTLVRGRAV